MKRILLTSNGLSVTRIRTVFKEMFTKPIEDVKVLFVPTAARTEDELVYVKKTADELIQAGINQSNIIWFDIDNYTENKEIIEVSDCICVCGGNTYYLLHKMKESGFDKEILYSLDKGLVYVGVSAGSVIASPDIEHISFLDENDIKLESMKALEIVDKHIIPHYEKKFDKLLGENRQYLGICDESAILYDNSIITII